MPRKNTKSPAGRDPHPSPKKRTEETTKESDDSEELVEIIRDHAQHVTNAKVSLVPLLLDPELLLDFVNIRCENPKKPLSDLKNSHGPKHMIVDHISNEKYHIEQARRSKKQMYNKEHKLRKKLLTITHEEFVAMQAETQRLDVEFNTRVDYCFKAKDRLTAQALCITME